MIKRGEAYWLQVKVILEQAIQTVGQQIGKVACDKCTIAMRDDFSFTAGSKPVRDLESQRFALGGIGFHIDRAGDEGGAVACDMVDTLRTDRSRRCGIIDKRLRVEWFYELHFT